MEKMPFQPGMTGSVSRAARMLTPAAPARMADTDVAITDSDSASLAGATITLTNPQTGDQLLAGAMPAGITASVAGNVVTLSGAATLAAYQTALQAITVQNTT